jgi:hypothetical protein
MSFPPGTVDALSRMRSARLTVATALFLVGCGSAHKPPPSARFKVDDQAGSLAGVRLESPIAAVLRAFGPLPGRNPVAEPSGSEHDAIGGPNGYAYPAHCRGYVSINNSDAAFAFCSGRLFVFVTTSDLAETMRGIRIGDSLQAAKRTYPELQCGASTGDSTDPPVPQYPYCSGRVGPGRYLWFGQDPIRSIAMGSVALHG